MEAAQEGAGLVLITGASGVVGTILRHHWCGIASAGAPARPPPFRLRLADLRHPDGDLHPHEHFTPFDLTSLDDCRRICEGVSTVVHLAADPGSEEFLDSLLPKNLLGPYNLLEGAVAAGVGRVILTSSIYAVRGHGPSPPITADRPTYPEGLYGATKTFLEAMGRVYSDTHGLSTVVVRLGNPRMEQGNDEQVPTDDPTYMLTPRDCAQLFERCVQARLPERFNIVHGSSTHRRMFLDIESTQRLLGYEPRDGTRFERRPTGDLTFSGRM